MKIGISILACLSLFSLSCTSSEIKTASEEKAPVAQANRKTASVGMAKWEESGVQIVTCEKEKNGGEGLYLKKGNCHQVSISGYSRTVCELIAMFESPLGAGLIKELRDKNIFYKGEPTNNYIQSLYDQGDMRLSHG